MIKNKRGLSTIVVTLIIIVLSLVAVGVVWVVVNNLLKSGTSSANINAQCLGVSLEVTQSNCSQGTTDKICDVQVTRSGTGTDALAGVMLVFKNSSVSTTGSYSSTPINIQGDIPALVGKRVTGIDTLVAKANGLNTIEVTPYFKDASGNVQLCSQTSSFSFIG